MASTEHAPIPSRKGIESIINTPSIPSSTPSCKPPCTDSAVLKSITLPGGRIFALTLNDIMYEPVEAIVNAANGGLSHGGGIAGTIADAAGSALDEEGYRILEARAAERAAKEGKDLASFDEYLLRNYGRLDVSDAVVTTAGKLAQHGYKGIIHTVGPRFGDGQEETKLAKAVSNSLDRANERGWQSVAVPGISAGIYSVPKDVCARAYLKGVLDHINAHPDSNVKVVRLCLLKGAGALADVMKGVMDAYTCGAASAVDISNLTLMREQVAGMRDRVECIFNERGIHFGKKGAEYSSLSGNAVQYSTDGTGDALTATIVEVGGQGRVVIHDDGKHTIEQARHALKAIAKHPALAPLSDYQVSFGRKTGTLLPLGKFYKA